MMFTIRRASLADRTPLEILIAESVRGLSASDYSPAQIEAAIGNTMGVDSELITDGTYFVVESDGAIIACGEWSKRETLFGADNKPGRVSRLLAPTTEAARIRAFFVHPGFARQGIGRMLLEKCESEIRNAGFSRAQLMATLPGRRLYEKYGYVAGDLVVYPITDAVSIEFYPMAKTL
ncbi:MAG: GNAT family N-acetyltransferase [Fibrella sp.]|nr:GNAT family N-acetyltransferase [Armatimonadota bacterium]